MRIEWPDGVPISDKLSITHGQAVVHREDWERNCMVVEQLLPPKTRLVIEGPADEVAPFADLVWRMWGERRKEADAA